MTPGVLISSAQERFSVAACRSLAAAGYRVGAVADQTPAATHWSRFCAARHTLPDPKADADGFVDGLAALEGYEVLLPATDAALLVVSSRRERLAHLALGLPPHETVVRATDKIALDEAGRASGLAVPDTVVCRTREEGLAADLGFPLAIKPRVTAFEDGGTVKQRASRVVADRAALEGAIDDFGHPFLLQRLVEGDVYSAAGVRTQDGIVAFALSHYLRTWPRDGGNVAFAVTVEPPAGLREQVDRLLDHIGWQGIFELEMIRSGPETFHAIDLNPRLYGSLAHATRAGAPLAVIAVDWIRGRPLRPVTARPGVRYRWEIADARNAIGSLRRGDLRDAATILRPHRDVAHAYVRRDDPLPLAARVILTLRTRAGR